jgi:hypothetical protein
MDAVAVSLTLMLRVVGKNVRTYLAIAEGLVGRHIEGGLWPALRSAHGHAIGVARMSCRGKSL